MVDNDAPLYSVGEEVLARDTGGLGVVIQQLPGNQYRVFFNQQKKIICAEGYLEPVSCKFGFVTPSEFLKDLLVFKLQKPLSNVLYSYSMSKTNFEAYQFKPAIKFLKNPNNRILIADEVGLGKTIEACIIYLELKARMQGDLPRVMVVCPAGLKEKWQSELYLRFDENFAIYNKADIEKFLDNYMSKPEVRLKCICSIETLRDKEVQQRIGEIEPQFDLIIIDEAHHMRNPDTLSFDLGQKLELNADNFVLMTATPVQLHSKDLFYLLNILDPGQFENELLFNYQLEPNKIINRAISELANHQCDVNLLCQTLDSCPQNLKDNPYYREARNIIGSITPNLDPAESRRLKIIATRNLHQLNPFSLVFNRTRRREVAKGAIREAVVIDVELTAIEKNIYETSLRFARAKANSEFNLGLIQVERMLASSIGAYKDTIEKVQYDPRSLSE